MIHSNDVIGLFLIKKFKYDFRKQKKNNSQMNHIERWYFASLLPFLIILNHSMMHIVIRLYSTNESF